jgi:hypothetical protein
VDPLALRLEAQLGGEEREAGEAAQQGGEEADGVAGDQDEVQRALVLAHRFETEALEPHGRRKACPRVAARQRHEIEEGRVRRLSGAEHLERGRPAAAASRAGPAAHDGELPAGQAAREIADPARRQDALERQTKQPAAERLDARGHAAGRRAVGPRPAVHLSSSRRRRGARCMPGGPGPYAGLAKQPAATGAVGLDAGPAVPYLDRSRARVAQG